MKISVVEAPQKTTTKETLDTKSYLVMGQVQNELVTLILNVGFVCLQGAYAYCV